MAFAVSVPAAEDAAADNLICFYISVNERGHMEDFFKLFVSSLCMLDQLFDLFKSVLSTVFSFKEFFYLMGSLLAFAISVFSIRKVVRYEA